ncbi:hypothetical protein TL16_g06191 [Triparma laevis f. inornata]|uniref:Uncharacterized protein n=2 Tax=Triparma laevis TaxID=1534972 RepID=A0A9W7F8V2_9STRA|nr:hypothetical protein TL16_g06191 [Triparma laevis f. inornata]GMI05014.1 hypothetical protein TrLO_g2866 [Triparma laevis f. longispina]
MSSSGFLPCTLDSFNGQACVGCEPWRMLEAKVDPKQSSWVSHNRAGQVSGPSFVLKLQKKSLLSYIELHNGGCSKIDVHVGLQRGKQNMIEFVSARRLARNRINEIKIGHIPCNYVKIIVKRGAPISIYQLRLSGIEADEVGEKMGSSTEYLLYKSTERMLYGKSLRMVRPVAKPGHDKMEKVGGDLPDKSYSFLTDINTPSTITISPDNPLARMYPRGENPVNKKLFELEEFIYPKGVESPDLYDILPEGVGGRAKKARRSPGLNREEVVMVV